jgi:Fe-S-cluster containining protein
MKYFSCTGCGNCCRYILPENSSATFPEFNGPLLQLRPPFITIEEWDMPRVKHAAERANIKIQAEPSLVLFDLKSKNTIVINYTTVGEPCAFLDANNRCRIYEDRPLICRAFPAPVFLTDMLLNKKIDIKWASFCDGCPETQEVKNWIVGEPNAAQLQFEEIIARLYEIWGESLVHRVWMESIAMAETRAIEGLVKDGLLKPAKKGYPITYLLKRMATAEAISLSEFYERIGRGKERRKMIGEFSDSYNSHKDMVEVAHKKYFGND